MGSIGTVSVEENASITVVLTATDADGDALALELANLPDFVTVEVIDGTSWRVIVAPGFDDSGDYTITARVTDSSNATDEETFDLQVADVNRAPVLSPIGDLIVAEGQHREVELLANDEDGDELTFSGVLLPAFASVIDNGTDAAVVAISPGYFSSGVHVIRVRVTDSGQLIDDIEFELTVANVNRPPVLSLPSNVTLAEGASISIALSATDPDNDATAFGLTATASFVSLTDNGDGSGGLLLAPEFSDSGNHSICVSASDAALNAEECMLIDVMNVNRDPTLSEIGDRNIEEGETLSIPVSASDPDDDLIELFAFGLPAFATFIDNEDGSGLVELAPDFGHSGVYAITMRAVDDLAGIDEEPFTITVDDVNRPPVLDLLPSVTLAEGDRVSYLFGVSDPDGDDLQISAEGLPDFVTIEIGGALRIEPKALDEGDYSVTIRVTDTGTPSLSDENTLLISVNTIGSNQVARENRLTGTSDWHLTNPALQREIEGYASATSVNRGDPIALYVNTSAPEFTLEVFRTGWYGGDGARLVLGPITVPGTAQITPAPDPSTGLVEANWTNPYYVQTSDSIAGNPWATGVYLARLTESVTSRQSYVIFVVREDGEHHDITFELPITTYQAYNAWGGKSLYDFNSGGVEPWGSSAGARASHVSFDRPYARNDTPVAAYGMGAGEYLTNVQPVGRIDGAGWDYNMVRWLEYEQYDINYITNLDTHRKSNGFNLTETELFLSQGHDEYWTWEMRDNVERSRDQGVDLAFFASNAAYYQIRLEPASSGIVDRVMVAYKDTLLDPVFTDADPDNDHLTTIPFRYSPVARPEEALIGVQYILDPYDGDIIVTNPAHWVFYNTGLSIGSRLTGLLGYEPDGIFGGGPSNLEILAETPIVSPLDPTQTGTSHMTIYEANTFSSVFATGSLQWSWGLDDYNAPSLRTSRLSAQAQQITSNVLEVFGANPGVGAPVSAWCIRFVSHADANGGLTTSAAELDLRDEHGYSVTKTGWSLFDVSSEEQASADAAAVYAFDGNMETYWQTNRSGPGHPHEIQIHLGTQTEVTALHYTPGQNIGLDGAVIDYEIHVSESPMCDAWDIVASGTWESTSGRKIARFPD